MCTSSVAEARAEREAEGPWAPGRLAGRDPATQADTKLKTANSTMSDRDFRTHLAPRDDATRARSGWRER